MSLFKIQMESTAQPGTVDLVFVSATNLAQAKLTAHLTYPDREAVVVPASPTETALLLRSHSFPEGGE